MNAHVYKNTYLSYIHKHNVSLTTLVEEIDCQIAWFLAGLLHSHCQVMFLVLTWNPVYMNWELHISMSIYYNHMYIYIYIHRYIYLLYSMSTVPSLMSFRAIPGLPKAMKAFLLRIKSV